MEHCQRDITIYYLCVQGKACVLQYFVLPVSSTPKSGGVFDLGRKDFFKSSTF
jgi:hypothetical protein